MQEARAAVRLNLCALNRRPPAKIEAPSTRSRLPMIEPVIEAFTTSMCPARSAIRAMMSSAALPKDALSNPPMPSPMRWASCSVAWPIQPASGMIARADTMNSAVPFCPPGM